MSDHFIRLPIHPPPPFREILGSPASLHSPPHSPPQSSYMPRPKAWCEAVGSVWRRLRQTLGHVPRFEKNRLSKLIFFFTKSAFFDWTVLDPFDLTAPKKHMTSPTRVYYICFRNSSISLLLLCILILAYEMKHMKHIVQKRKFQQSSTFFWVGAHF